MTSRKTFLEGYISTIQDKDSKTRYLLKLKAIGGLDPYETTRGEWEDDLDLWPGTTSIHIGMYLLLTPSPYSKQDLLNYKSLDCYVNFLSGWVREILVREVANDKRVIIAKVNHSQRLSEKPLIPWIIAKPDGEIITAHCNCMAGLGETCSHVASVLWAIESGVRLRDSLTVTQKKAYWVIPHAIKQVPYATVSEISFVGKKKSQKFLFNTPTPSPSLTPPAKSSTIASAGGNNRKTPPLTPTQEEVNVFFASIASTSKRPAILSLVEPYSNQYIPSTLHESLPMCLSELKKPDYIEYSYSQLLKLARETSISVTMDQVQAVESKTKLQAKTPLWFRMRTGRVTASLFKRVSCTDPASPSISLIMQICHPELNRFKTVATNWGCEHEKVALSEYYEAHSSKCKHGNVEVDQCGLFLDLDNPYIGASPDGVVTCSSCGDGICEIKCPHCHKDENIVEATCGDKSFCLAPNSDGNIEIKRDHTYYYQVQCQLFCTKRSYCDFVLWTNRDIHIERVYPDEDFWHENLERAKQFFLTAIMPELLGKFYSRPTLSFEDTSNTQEEVAANDSNDTAVNNSNDTFCYCGGPEEGEMVGCDNSKCSFQWFHLECIGLKSLPRSKYWYCPDCRKIDEFKCKKLRKQ